MTSDDVKIWVKVEDGKPRGTTGVRVKSNADIDDLIAAALEQEKVDHPQSLVTVKFGEAEIRKDRLVTDFDTTCSYENPLLLKCPDECEGIVLGECKRWGEQTCSKSDR